MSKKVSLTTVVQMSPYGAQLLMQKGLELRGQESRGQPISWAGHKRFLPVGDYPVVPLTAHYWREYVGGLLVYTKVPKLDGTGLEAARISVIFDDPQAARRVYQIAREALRGSCHLKYVDGRWYASMNWKTKEGLIAVRRRGEVKWVPARKSMRWQKAPDGWPRDRYYHPLSELQMKRRGLWPFVPPE